MKSRNVFIFVCLAAFAQCTTWGFLRVVARISTSLLFIAEQLHYTDAPSFV